ncbi:BTAD domain-containing putative transcriptional regulator [Streptosporangium sp. NPDC049046]|uniref:AfsR/SARP family transcriptional regulator n=1 Tax=Streptosporangium sp. NPDC049046 TaxID=3155031 RepID=UPI00344276D1
MNDLVQVHLLGPVRATRGDHELDLGSPTQRALFAALATRPGTTLSRQELINAVWGPNPPITVESSIYTYVARLRRTFEPKRPRRAPSGLLVADANGYLLQLDARKIDVQVFEKHLEDVRELQRSGPWPEAVKRLEAALALWRGPAFGGAVGPLADTERIRLDELRVTAIEDRAQLLLEADRATEIISDLSSLVRTHPMRERLHHLLMVAHYRCGRRADALKQFHSVRRLLIRELGIEPGEDLRRCHDQILNGTLRSPAPAPDSPVTLSSPDNALPPAFAPPPAQLPRDIPGFTGRLRELERLEGFVTAADRLDEAGLILISGAPGVGKSALALRFARSLTERFDGGQLHLDLRGFSNTAQPMMPAEALDHLLAGLGSTPKPSEDLQVRSSRYRSLVAGKRILIVLDNARSAEQVRPLLPGDPSCLVLVTSRNRLSGLTTRDGALRMTLDLMPKEDAATLVRHVIRQANGYAEHPLVHRLCQVGDHLPIALRIAAERMTSRFHGGLTSVGQTPPGREDLLESQDVECDEQSSMRSVFSSSYLALPNDAAEMFRLMSLHEGPTFDLTTAAVTADVDVHRARQSVDYLLSGHLLRITPDNRLRFHDGMLRAYAKDRAVAEMPYQTRRAAVSRFLGHYVRTADIALRLLYPGRCPVIPPLPAPQGVPRPRFECPEQARNWLETELPNLTVAARQAQAYGVSHAKERLPPLIQNFLHTRPEAHTSVPANSPRPEGPPSM